MKRPSHKEITGKIIQAKKAVSNGCVFFINPVSLTTDALELGFLFNDEIEDVLMNLLDKASPENYVGRKPPQQSYEQEIYGFELFAFRTKCDILNETVYLKFTLFDKHLYLISLHKHRATINRKNI